MIAIRMIIAAIVGLAMDWALFERWKMTFQVFRDSDEVKYRDLPRPRLILTVISSAAIGLSLTPQRLLALPFWTGIAIFVASNVYAASKALRR